MSAGRGTPLAQRLAQKLDQLRASGAPAALVAKLGAFIASAGDEELARINPFSFAPEDADRAIDLFVHAVKVGLCDLRWNTVCPFCGAVEHVHDRLDEVPRKKFPCTMCHAQLRADLDVRTEVTFAVSSSIRSLRVDRFASRATYLAHHLSPSYRHSPEYAAWLAQASLGWLAVPPGATRALSFDIAPRDRVRLLSLDIHSAVVLHGRGRSSTAEIEATDQGFVPARGALAAGPATLRVHNRREQTVGALLVRWDARRYHALVAAHPPARTPYLTASRLLATQSFRTLFRAHDVDPRLTLNVSSVTLVFTDLRGSTAIYDRLGDPAAYTLVREHFRVVGRAVAQHRGAIVKTMGDAVMATFATPEDAVAAVLAIDAAVVKLRSGDEQLELKVGVHEGPALVVNADGRLDYFGQTVNVAARVQGAAAANEICLTEGVRARPGVAALLRRRQVHERRESVRLRGIGEPTTIVRVRR